MRMFYLRAFLIAVFLVFGGERAHAQTGACCLGGGTCIATDFAGCETVLGDYVGDGSVCEAAACVAACCFPDSTCSAEFRDDCEALSGTYQGPGTTCSLHCAASLLPVFTYQGQLTELGRPVNGLVDLQLSLWPSARGGLQVGASSGFLDVVVKHGLFSVPASFPPGLFDGDNRWLEVAVRSPAWDGTGVEPGYTTLSPRQLITSTPHALQTRGLFVDDVGNIAVGHTSPVALLHMRGADDPTIKIQSDGDSEISGRLSLRQANDTGVDLYYDGTFAEALTIQAIQVDVPTIKLMKINRRLLTPSAADRVEIAGRVRFRSVDLDASRTRTNLVIGHVLITPQNALPAAMVIDFTKSDGPEPSARIEFNGDNDPLSHHGDLRFHTRSPTDAEVVERMRIAEDGMVGVGTQSPTTQLDVIGQVRSRGANGGLITAVNPNNQTAQVHLSWLNDVARIRIGGSGAGTLGGLDIQAQGDRSLMRILDSGRVGIGTENPQSLLQVGEGDESAIRLGLNPQMVLSRDVANSKFRMQLTGSGFQGNALQLGRDDGNHDILLSGKVRATRTIHSVNAAGGTRVKMGLSINGDHGAVQVYGSTGREIVKIAHSGSVGGLVSGAITVKGPNAQNVVIGANGSNLDHGLVAVMNASGQTKAGIMVNALGQGELFGDVKSFRVANPRDASTDIWYASLEGPEAAAYYRGTAMLTGGRAAISLPDHFSDVSSHTSLTVHLTPRSAASKGLAFTGVRDGEVIVEELLGGSGSYEFDYLLVDVRSGHEGFQVVRPALRNRRTPVSDTLPTGDAAPLLPGAEATQSERSTGAIASRTAEGVGLVTSGDAADSEMASLRERIERLELILTQQAANDRGLQR